MIDTHANFLRCFALAFLLGAAALRADDWPNWRGPDHNGISAETGWVAKWPAEGPPRLWKTSVGTGFSSLAVAHGRVYTMGNKGDIDTVFCLDAETGKPIWKQSYSAAMDRNFYEGGPSATPTADGNRVYTLSKSGSLFCYAAETGKILWAKNIASQFSFAIPQWGFASSGLINGNLIVFNVGALGAAFDKATGKVAWTTGTEKSGYSTPVPCSYDSHPALAMMTAAGVAAVDPVSGKTLWQYPWKADYDLNCADPVVAGDRLFVSSSYAKMGALLEFQNGAAKAVWRNGNMRNQLNSTVLLNGYLYGIDGIAGPTPNASLKCVSLADGSVKWDFPEVGGGALMIADGKIIALSDKGELFVGEASPQGFNSISRAQVLGGKCWTVPVLANGRIYCRNARGDLVCLDVKAR